MSFFEPPDLPPEPPVEHRQPAWLGPASNILGAAVPLRLLLAHTDDVAVAISEATAYPNGVELGLALRVRSLSNDARRALMYGGPFHRGFLPGDDPGTGIPPELLRLGVQFADGRKATTLEGRHWHGEGEPVGPVLQQRGGGGGDKAWDMRLWLWPLPPPGALAFVVEWPLAGIAETRVEIDAGSILAAATEATTLWPEGETVSGGGWVSNVMLASSEARPAPTEPEEAG